VGPEVRFIFVKQNGLSFGKWQRRWAKNDGLFLQLSRLSQVLASVSLPATTAPDWVIKNKAGEAQQDRVEQLAFLATACR